MLANFLYSLFPYQLFKSVFFRAGLGFLTTYFLVSVFIPHIVHIFRKRKITSSLNEEQDLGSVYHGPTPIMGGITFIPSIIIAPIPIRHREAMLQA